MRNEECRLDPFEESQAGQNRRLDKDQTIFESRNTERGGEKNQLTGRMASSNHPEEILLNQELAGDQPFVHSHQDIHPNPKLHSSLRVDSLSFGDVGFFFSQAID